MKGPSITSRLYDCQVTHSRVEPARHAFRYNYFTFCLDLDEIDSIAKKSWVFGTSKLNVFRFVPVDFIFGQSAANANEMKAVILDYARKKGVHEQIKHIELVAHMRTFGYIFNPAAFYFCYGDHHDLLCAIVEVTNTYREKKAYFIPGSTSHKKCLEASEIKHFYVSPFVDVDACFEFKIEAPGDLLRLQIDSVISGKVQVHSFVTGNPRSWADLSLLTRLLRYPLVTLGVILKIHYQAALLYLKRVPFFRKTDRIELQKGGLL